MDDKVLRYKGILIISLLCFSLHAKASLYPNVEKPFLSVAPLGTACAAPAGYTRADIKQVRIHVETDHDFQDEWLPDFPIPSPKQIGQFPDASVFSHVYFHYDYQAQIPLAQCDVKAMQGVSINDTHDLYLEIGYSSQNRSFACFVCNAAKGQIIGHYT